LPHDIEALGWDEGRTQDLHGTGAPARVVAVHRGRVALHDGRLVPVAGALRHDGIDG
jgi:hypothetical protein